MKQLAVLLVSIFSFTAEAQSSAVTIADSLFQLGICYVVCIVYM
jgi:hypothetical protein